MSSSHHDGGVDYCCGTGFLQFKPHTNTDASVKMMVRMETVGEGISEEATQPIVLTCEPEELRG